MAKVEVRIAVAIDSNSDWNATGWKGSSDYSKNQMLDTVSDGLDGSDIVYYWVTAELEVPEVPKVKEIKGKIDKE